jgi:hypothetical protein
MKKKESKKQRKLKEVMKIEAAYSGCEVTYVTLCHRDGTKNEEDVDAVMFDEWHG